MKFCQACSIVKSCIDDLEPSISFIDIEKLVKGRDASLHTCDLVYKDNNKVLYIEHKYIFYFCRYMKVNNVIQENLSEFLKDMKGKIDNTHIYMNDNYEDLSDNRKFILFISKSVGIPSNNATVISNNQIVASLIPSQIISAMRTSLMGMENMVGNNYTAQNNAKIKVLIDECQNISKYIWI